VLNRIRALSVKIITTDNILSDIPKVDLTFLLNARSTLERKLSEVNTAIEHLSGERVGGIAWTVKAINCIKGFDRPVRKKIF